MGCSAGLILIRLAKYHLQVSSNILAWINIKIHRLIKYSWCWKKKTEASFLGLLLARLSGWHRKLRTGRMMGTVWLERPCWESDAKACGAQSPTLKSVQIWGIKITFKLKIFLGFARLCTMLTKLPLRFVPWTVCDVFSVDVHSKLGWQG